MRVQASKARDAAHWPHAWSPLGTSIRQGTDSSAIDGAPGSLTIKRNLDLSGRARGPLYRRGLLGLVGVLPVLALLNVFGQDPSTSRSDSPEASLSVTAPSALRGGLVFQVRLDIAAHQDLAKPQVVMSRGWWQEMSVNSIEPSPSTETTSNGAVVLSFDKLPAGHKLAVWLYFQVNPTNVGTQAENVILEDGDRPLTAIHRSVTVFP